MYFVVLLLLAVVNCQASVVRYDNYKVYRVFPQNTKQQQILHALGKNDIYDIWLSSKILSEPWDIKTSPALAKKLESILISNNMKFEIFIDNLEKKRIIQNNRVYPLKSGGISFEKYNRYSEIKAYLHSLAELYPKTVTLLNIGSTFEGRDFLGLKISSGGSNKPAILVDAGIHAREWMAPATALYIIQELVENPNHANMFENVDWYIFPLFNSDGYEYSHTEESFWRKTRSKTPSTYCVGVDGNRNFDFHWMEIGASVVPCADDYAGPKGFSEKETQAIRDFALKHNKSIKLYLTFHSYGQYILYPWGYTSAYPENREELHSLGENVHDAIRAVRNTTYKVGSSTNALYAAAGGSDDWMMGVANISLSYTIELPGRDGGFQPSASEIVGVVEETFEGVKVYHKYVQDKYTNN